MRQLVVILRQQRVIQRLIAVLMHQHGGRHPRLDVRVIRRPAKAKAEQRQDVLWQLQQLGHRLDAVAQPADIDAAQPEGLGGGQRVLRQQRRIDNADQQLFRQPQLRLRADLQVAIKVGAEDPNSAAWATCCWPPVSGTRRSRRAGSVIRMMEVHCKNSR